MLPIENDKIRTHLTTLIKSVLESTAHVVIVYKKNTAEDIIRDFTKIETGFLQNSFYDDDRRGKLARFFETTNDGDLIIDILKEHFGVLQEGRLLTEYLKDVKAFMSVIAESAPGSRFFPNIDEVAADYGFVLPANPAGSHYVNKETVLRGIMSRADRLVNEHDKTKAYTKNLRDIFRIMRSNPAAHEDVVTHLFGEAVLNILDDMEPHLRFDGFIKTIIARGNGRVEGAKVILKAMKKMHDKGPYIRFMGTSHLVGPIVKCEDSAAAHVKYVEAEIKTPNPRHEVTARILSFVHRSPYQEEICYWLIPDAYRYDFEEADARKRGMIFEEILASRLLDPIRPATQAEPTASYAAHESREVSKQEVEKVKTPRSDNEIINNLIGMLNVADEMTIEQYAQRMVDAKIWPTLESIPPFFYTALAKQGVQYEKDKTAADAAKLANAVEFLKSFGERFGMKVPTAKQKEPEMQQRCMDPDCPACGDSPIAKEQLEKLFSDKRPVSWDNLSQFTSEVKLSDLLSQFKSPEEMEEQFDIGRIISERLRQRKRTEPEFLRLDISPLFGDQTTGSMSILDSWIKYMERVHGVSSTATSMFDEIVRQRNLKACLPLTTFEEEIVHAGRRYHLGYNSDAGVIEICTTSDNPYGTVAAANAEQAIRKITMFKRIIVGGGDIVAAFKGAVKAS